MGANEAAMELVSKFKTPQQARKLAPTAWNGDGYLFAVWEELTRRKSVFF